MFIAFGGIDGCGKSLQVKMLTEHLASQQRPTVVTKAYDEEAKLTCRPFLETWTDEMAITFLFQALHAQQYFATTRALDEGKIVIADRWDENFFGYHENYGALSRADSLRVTLNDLAFRKLLPDIGFIIQVPVEIARKRRISRGTVERFESRADDHFQRIQDTYLAIARQRGWHVLNGLETPEEIHGQVVRIIGNH